MLFAIVVWLRFARLIGLRLLSRLELTVVTALAKTVTIPAITVAFIKGTIARFAFTIGRILLTELLLHRGNHPEVMFGVLEIVFCSNRIAGRL